MIRSMILSIGLIVSAIAPQIAEARLDVYPTYLPSFQAPVGGQSFSERISVRNAGRETIDFLNVYSSCFSDWWVTNWCYSTLRPGDSCTIDVRFTPNRAGYHSCGIDISGSGVFSEHVSLSGRATERGLVESDEEASSQDTEAEAGN